MASSLQQMLARAHNADGNSCQSALISAYEAEQLVQGLQPTAIEQVGDARFMQQHDAIQKLNLQAHHNAQTHSDEFVMELLISLDKLPVLVQELLVIEAWKERLFPLLAGHLAEGVDSATTYLVLYHEAAVANLLEVVLFHRHACEALGEDPLLELADWSMRKLAHLNSGAYAHAGAPERSVQEVLDESPAAELAAKRAETDFAASLCGLTVLRYLTDALPALHHGLGLMGRLLSAHDAVMALLPLVEKFIDGRWQLVPPADRLKITQLDGQVWLSLVNLLVEPACRAKYNPDEFRRGALLRLQRHLHELLLDQLPVLRQLASVLDELALGVAPAAADGGGGGRLILEQVRRARARRQPAASWPRARLRQLRHAPRRVTAVHARRGRPRRQVPTLRAALLAGKDWAGIAAAQAAAQFGPAAKRMGRERLAGLVQQFELLCAMEEAAPRGGGGGGGGGGGAREAEGLLGGGGADEAAVLASRVRVVASRQVHAGGIWEPWCEFTAALDAGRAGEPVTVSGEQVNGGAAPAADAGAVRGRRYRLAAMDVSDTRALPTHGKVAVHFMGAVAEALLTLPEVPLRGSDGCGAPAALWLTVGLLAADGFALQLRLKRAERPSERDRQAGWFAYHPVGGAITVLLPPEDDDGGGTRGAGGGAGAKARAAAPASDVAPVKP
ncbi:Zmynd10 [Scenedesmus sp. PABB004]|nr:Zmynd10 [Scenedesmus sp. PABB004]